MTRIGYIVIEIFKFWKAVVISGGDTLSVTPPFFLNYHIILAYISIKYTEYSSSWSTTVYMHTTRRIQNYFVIYDIRGFFMLLLSTAVTFVKKYISLLSNEFTS